MGESIIELPPIRCYSCGKVLGNLYEPYKNLLALGVSHTQAVSDLGLRRWCCMARIQNPSRIAIGLTEPPPGVTSIDSRTSRRISHSIQQFEENISTLEPNILTTTAALQSLKLSDRSFVSPSKSTRTITPSTPFKPRILKTLEPLTVEKKEEVPSTPFIRRPIIKPLEPLSFEEKEEIPSTRFIRRPRIIKPIEEEKVPTSTRLRRLPKAIPIKKE